MEEVKEVSEKEKLKPGDTFKGLLGLLLVGFVISLFIDSEPKWLMYGSSHGVDWQEWDQSNYEKQLGTSGYWLINLDKKGYIQSTVVSDENLHPNAETLTRCIDSAERFLKINEVVAVCVQREAWAK